MGPLARRLLTVAPRDLYPRTLFFDEVTMPRIPLDPLLLVLGLITPAAVASAPHPEWSLLVTPAWVEAHREEVTVVDVRKATAFYWGHVPGAVRVTWKTFSDPDATYPGNLNSDVEQLETLLGTAGIPSSKPVVLVSDPRENWGEEGRIFWMLELLGHTKVALMDGGHPRWKKEGRALERGPTSPAAATFDGTWNAERIVGWSEIQQRLQDPTLVILDTRSQEEYEGATPYGEVRGGRIPGAKHLHWQDLLNTDGTFKSVTEMKSLVEARGLTPEREAALYCTGGVRSGFVYFVLRLLGYPKARNYDGSFWEWAARSELPVEK